MADRLSAIADTAKSEDLARSTDKLKSVATEVSHSFSGSWLGYHSRVYYEGFSPPPPGNNFSQEWGLGGDSFLELRSTGDWREFAHEAVKAHIRGKAGQPNLEPVLALSVKASEYFKTSQADTESVLANEISINEDEFLTRIKVSVEKLKLMTKRETAESWSPNGSAMTRDSLAVGQGIMIPPHIELLAEVAVIENSFDICRSLAEACRMAATHIERKGRRIVAAKSIGTNVFIGHGRSTDWRELKDFVQDRLSLPWDEFNRVPVAGVTNIARLSEMLDAAAIAFLIMTGEDEAVGGELLARMNVVHEAGLFQGRLGFTKAIVLLEEGCQEFSNIQGLGQIRYSKGKIADTFEEVRKILEREELITPHSISNQSL